MSGTNSALADAQHHGIEYEKEEMNPRNTQNARRKPGWQN
jgi:hypothetical protein